MWDMFPRFCELGPSPQNQEQLTVSCPPAWKCFPSHVKGSSQIHCLDITLRGSSSFSWLALPGRTHQDLASLWFLRGHISLAQADVFMLRVSRWSSQIQSTGSWDLGADLALCFELGCIPKLSKQHILDALFAVAQELTGTVQIWMGGRETGRCRVMAHLFSPCSFHQMPGRKTQSKQISNLMSFIPLPTHSSLFALWSPWESYPSLEESPRKWRWMNPRHVLVTGCWHCCSCWIHWTCMSTHPGSSIPPRCWASHHCCTQGRSSSPGSPDQETCADFTECRELPTERSEWW